MPCVAHTDRLLDSTVLVFALNVAHLQAPMCTAHPPERPHVTPPSNMKELVAGGAARLRCWPFGIVPRVSLSSENRTHFKRSTLVLASSLLRMTRPSAESPSALVCGRVCDPRLEGGSRQYPDIQRATTSSCGQWRCRAKRWMRVGCERGNGVDDSSMPGKTLEHGWGSRPISLLLTILI